VRCFQCDEDATQECPRCGALFCDAHGDALCERCTDPALALPSYRVYRGSLAALFIGSIVAVWLLILPPAAADQDGPPDTIASLVNTRTPTPEPTPVEAPEPTPPPAVEPEEPQEPEEPTPTPTPEPTPEQQTYVVQAGDTLLGIADRFAPSGVDSGTFANRIQEANGITDASQLQIGQELVIPQD